MLIKPNKKETQQTNFLVQGNHYKKLTKAHKEILSDICDDYCTRTVPTICDIFYERTQIRICRMTEIRSFKTSLVFISIYVNFRTSK